MWVLFFCKRLFVFGIPLLILWLWRGKFLPKNLVGTRLEIHRQQLWRSAKQVLTVWGMMALSAADQLVRWNHVSHDFHQFWFGFSTASDLFLIGLLIVNTLPFFQELREKRRAQLSKATSFNRPLQ